MTTLDTTIPRRFLITKLKKEGAQDVVFGNVYLPARSAERG